MRQGVFWNELTITPMHHRRQNIKRRATETKDPAPVISGRELGGILEAAAINLTALHHISSASYKIAKIS